MANRNTMQEKLIDSEKLVERKLKEAVEGNGGMCIKLVPLFMSGLPDRMILLSRGTIFFVELKTTKLAARKLQNIVHNMLRKLGFAVYIIDTVEDAKSVIKLHKKLTNGHI